ncbi:hypothetical protein VNO80_00669 [Phaseolus coccineus]|uniref:Uncharacterized protein n=1 Tax=Phaseolus coccineus TaxID=3886 RepID=A0AAN9P5J3_PHACN
MPLLPSSSLYFSLSSNSDIQIIPPHFTFIQTPFGFPFLAFFFIASSPSRLTSTLVLELITLKPSSVRFTLVALLAGAVATRHLGMLHFPYLHFMVHDMVHHLVHHSCAPRYQNSLHGSKGATSIYEEGGASTLTNHFNGL